MKIIKEKIKKEGGYAILFTVVVVGIISMITIGLSNAAYKQMVLSSVARDSTTAFYQADIASECALYADRMEFLKELQPLPTFSCATHTLKYGHIALSNLYTLNPESETSSSKCFRIEVTKTEDNDSIATKVEAMGYNICNKSNKRTVERAIEINY